MRNSRFMNAKYCIIQWLSAELRFSDFHENLSKLIRSCTARNLSLTINSQKSVKGLDFFPCTSHAGIKASLRRNCDPQFGTLISYQVQKSK